MSLRAKFDDLAKSQGYVSNEEYEALKILATRLEERITKLEELIKNKNFFLNFKAELNTHLIYQN